MILFWDTSAIVATIQQEPHSAAAREAVAHATISYAWSWMQVEAEGALARRGATPAQWAQLARQLSAIRFEDIPRRELKALCARNRDWRLRAGDAGHLFCFARIATVLPSVQLVTFDSEMRGVARRLKFVTWAPASPAGPAVRERRGIYRARRRKPLPV